MKEKNYNLLCRICLKRSCLCSNIYVGQSADKDPIYEVINYVYDLQISVDDGLPGYICQRCLAIVKEFKVYKTNAHKAKTELLRSHQVEDVFIKEERAESESENEEFTSFEENRTVEDRVNGPVLLKYEMIPFQNSADEKIGGDACNVSVGTEASSVHEETWDEADTLKEEEGESFELENDLERTEEFDEVTYSEQFEERLPIKMENSGGSANSNVKSRPRRNVRGKQYQCENCGIKFLEKQILKKHLSLHCRKEREKNSGDWRFSELDGQNIHAVVHSLNDPCQEQEESFPQLEDSTVNTLVKNYQCEECGRKFARCHSFKAHMRVHSRENPNQCTICGRSFSQRFDLVRHYESTHLKLKPFQCAECGRCFARKYHLVRHIKVHHVVVIE